MKKIYLFLTAAALTFTACSDSLMNEINTDETKATSIAPSAQLTTGLLQTYGDFGLMDTYRSYVTGFTQHFAGGWNVTNFAGSVHAEDDQMRLVWDQFYNVAIKNMVDAIANSADKPSTNAALRIHLVYIMSMLTDIYGDIPCKQAGKGYTEGISTPVYDKQEDIYNWFFEELAACVDQLGKDPTHIDGDVTSLKGSPEAWRKYANSLRMRFAMRISDKAPEKAREEFEKAVKADGGYISSSNDDAYIIYTDGPFTLYAGSRDLDFRVNALGEMLYGQDSESPTFVCYTFFSIMKDNNDPRLFRVCRHYINNHRSDLKPDEQGNIDLTEDVENWLATQENPISACKPGEAWYDNWINPPANEAIPGLAKIVEEKPDAGYDKNNYNARLLRPFLNIDFEKPNRPGALINFAEVEFLLAEAILKGWTVPGSMEEHYKTGIRAAMEWMNTHYLETVPKIQAAEVETYIQGLIANGAMSQENAKEAINTQAWILHMMNPSEAWANLRRSDYPTILDRTKLPSYNWTIDDKAHMETPMRLRYPVSDRNYNSVNYDEAVSRMGTKNEKGEYIDDWHKPVWWDEDYYHVK